MNRTGMNVAAGPELAAAVTNAGGLGVIGGLGYTPKVLRQQVKAFRDLIHRDIKLMFNHFIRFKRSKATSSTNLRLLESISFFLKLVVVLERQTYASLY